jgi:hypothetical protein
MGKLGHQHVENGMAHNYAHVPFKFDHVLSIIIVLGKVTTLILTK